MKSTWLRLSHNQILLICQGLLNILGGVMNLTMRFHSTSLIFYLSCFLVIVSGIAGSIVGFRNTNLSDKKSSFLFFMVLAPVYLFLWIDHEVGSNQTKFWIPFQPHLLSCLTVAILTPPIKWIGVLSIVLFPVLACIQFFTFSADQLAWFPANALWSAVVFGVFALVLYFYRIQSMKIALSIARSNAKLEMLKKMAQSAAAIKDLTNSPIQNLTFDAEILRQQYPNTVAIANRIDLATSKINELNKVMETYLRTEPEPQNSLALDAKTDLGKNKN